MDADPHEEAEQNWGRRPRFAAAALRRVVARRRIAIVLSGGGSQGSFEMGALRFLYDHLSVHPAALCGSSVGAVMAAKLAEGDEGQGSRRAIDELEQVWRRARSNDDMWSPEPWFETLRREASWATELREQVTGNWAGASQARVVLRLLTGMVRHAPSADGTVEALRAAFRAKSLLNLDPLRGVLEENLDPRRVAASGIKLRVSAVSLESGEVRYITENGLVTDRDDVPLDIAPVSLVDAVLASAAIPVIFPPVRLGDEHYVDGGTRQILPLELAFGHFDVHHIFAIVASAPGVERASSFEDRGLFDIARRVATEIAPNELLRKEIEPPRGWGRRVTFVVPEFDVHDALVVDPEMIATAIDYGYMRCADVVLGLGAKAQRLTAEITRTRVRLRQLDGEALALAPGLVELPLGAVDEAAVARERASLAEALDLLVGERRRQGFPLPEGIDERTNVVMKEGA